MRYFFFGAIVLSSLLFVGSANAQTDVVCATASVPPVVDGDGTDSAWSQSTSIVTHDLIAKIDIQLRCVYTNDEIFFLVSYPDASENSEHKTYSWDKNTQHYRTGPSREDSFVFKWNMEPVPVDLTLSGDTPYTADVWFWKSMRTNHSGYADDKYQIYAYDSMPKATKLINKFGRQVFLARRGDEGTPAYQVKTYAAYVNDAMPKYIPQASTGSRADVRAKGVWHKGHWVVEFGRRLVTGHSDDIELDSTLDYQFGVSRYEIAGRALDPNIEVPAFGSGEISDDLNLIFAK